MNNIDIEFKNVRYMDRCFYKADDLKLTFGEFWDMLEAHDYDFELVWNKLNG